MHRSNTISNFLESKTKKKWSNPFSSKSSRDSLIDHSKRQSTLSHSPSSAGRAISRLQPTLRADSSQSSTSFDTKCKKRSSLMISSNTATTTPLSSAQKHKSYIGFGSLRVDTTTVTDAKELEFYNQLLNSSKTAGNITEEEEEEEDYDAEGGDCEGYEQKTAEDYQDSSSFSISHASDELCSTTTTSTTLMSSREDTSEKTMIPETLTSILEDYQLFTKRNSLLTPSYPIFPTPTEGDIAVDCKLPLSNSLPSLASVGSIDSVMSVMKVSNSLWVGITDEAESAKADALDGFDADGVFSDMEEDHFVRFTRSTSHRTSLIFA